MAGLLADDRWVERLPALVERMVDEFGLELDDRPAREGADAVVLGARRGGEPCVLKLSWHPPTVADEAAALTAWGGHGAVRLLDARVEAGALLLERLDAGRTLHDVALLEAAAVAGLLIRRLSVPAPPGLPEVRRYAAEVADGLAGRNERLGSPVPDEWVALAAGLERRLAADAGSTLVHADLHYGNVLAATREPWLGIDPHAVAGDPELSVPELLWTRLDEVAGGDDLTRLIDTIVASGDLDRRRAWEWSVVRAVDYWLWGLPFGLTEDPVRCRRLVAMLIAE